VYAAPSTREEGVSENLRLRGRLLFCRVTSWRRRPKRLSDRVGVEYGGRALPGYLTGDGRRILLV
jgi:hypothetical protein